MVKKVKLISICKPKQYKTLSKIDLIENGKFPVYGANGIIGKSDKFTHENPTLMVTCRGATCGTLNISEPNSYINGNAMAFDDINEEFDLKYLYYYLFTRGFNDVISGSAQPQITRENLKNLEVLKPLLEQQKQIAKTLDKANELVELRKESIAKLDALAKSIFIDMFGDPVSNPKKWEIKKLKEILKNIDSGWSPICNNYPSRNNNFGILKLSSLSNDVYNDNENKEMIDGVAPKIEALVLNGDLLFSRKNTYMLVGSCAYVFNTKDNLFMPDLIFRLNTNSEVEKIFLWKYMVNEKNKIRLRNIANGAAASMPNISKAKLMDFEIYLPPLDLQNKFAKIIEKIEEQKSLYTQELEKLQINFDALLQKSFQ